MTERERELMPILVAHWERKLKAVAELTPDELMNAQIAICEARRMLRAAQELNAQIADQRRER